MGINEATAYTCSYVLSFLGPVVTIITAIFFGEELTVSKVNIMIFSWEGGHLNKN